jgi:hypothetical protein
MLAISEFLAETERIRDPSFFLLIRVFEVAHTEMPAVPKHSQEVTRMGTTSHDHDLVNASLHQRLNRIIDHRLVVNRQEVLVGREGQRVEPRPESSRENDPLHDPPCRRVPVPVGTAPRP